MARMVACTPLATLGLSLGLGLAAFLTPAHAGPLLRGGVGGPNSGAGVLPGAGFGQAGPGLVNPAPAAAAPAVVAPVAPVVRPTAGGVGGPASGAGVLPGAGVGRAGLGL